MKKTKKVSSTIVYWGLILIAILINKFFGEWNNLFLNIMIGYAVVAALS